MENKFAVIGFPLGHTMSPFIHKKLFELSQLDATYEAFETHPDLLKEKVDFLKAFKGFNITIPHKETIIPFIDRLDSSAEIYGAVNTVAIKDGILTGYNTDADGFKAALALENIPLRGKVLLCGCGGVARTIAIESVRCGCEVTIAVRNRSARALSLVNEIKTGFGANIRLKTILDGENPIKPVSDLDEEFDLAVNGTSVGMYPKTNGSVLQDSLLLKTKAVFDTVYNPENTLLTKRAGALGVKAVSGMGMLVMQAAKAHQHWYGAEFKDSDMKELIAKANDEMRRLFVK